MGEPFVTAQRKKQLKRKNRTKRIRTFVQYAVIIGIAAFLLKPIIAPKTYEPLFVSFQDTQVDSALPSQNTVPVSDEGFICISYSGVVKYDKLSSSIVSNESFEAQMDALKASGYVTISQQDILNYYLYGGELPQKALYLVMEDGIKDTTIVVQSTLEKNQFLATACTYSKNLYDVNSKFLSVSDCKKLLKNSFWELGSNGHRLSYINVFDRYENYYGHLNADEYTRVVPYLSRNYNHYLMDFKRDSDYLSQESTQTMENRLAEDYQSMKTIYTDSFGFVPQMYVLMHSNTGMFGTNSQASAQNGKLLTNTFAMNFNRQGSCYNTLSSSIYDLTRLQPQAYWSTNHLLMRIWDDTGHDVAFVVGDEKAAEKWYVDEGKAEFKEDEIILTTMPYEYGRMTLAATALTDLALSVTLDGNTVGQQAVYLRSDRNLSSGIRVALDNNHLLVTEMGDPSLLLDVDLFELDGGATVSVQEDEHNGLMALCEAIIDYDLDETRVAQAKAELAKLKAMNPVTLAQGGAPYVPELDISKRDSRDLRLQLEGNSLSIWLDDQLVADNLLVGTTNRGTVVLESGVWTKSEVVSQRNLADDVYDGVFTNLCITDPKDEKQVYYAYMLNEAQTVSHAVKDVVETVISFFVTHF